MRVKKALFIATVGGFVTQFELNNVSLLQAAGYEVHSAANFREPVYCVREQELTRMGVELHQVDMEKSPFMWRQNLRALRQLCRIIRREDITLLHCHTPVGGLLGRLAGILCAGKGLKVVYTAHGFHFYRGAPWKNWLLYYPVERLLARWTDVLVTINEEDYARAGGFRLRRGGRVFRIPGEGLRTENLQVPQPQERAGLRRELGIDEDTFFLLSVGELSHNKNHGFMIRLLPAVKERLAGRKVVYGICGDGFCRGMLEDLAAERGLCDSVVFYGYRPDAARILACADCLVFPSVREGLGMAALEAMALGVPVAAADNRGTREYMRDGQNGFVCRLEEPESFVDAVEKICRMRPKELAAMGARERQTALEFDMEKAGAAMAEVYAFVDVALEREGTAWEVRGMCRR